MNRENSTNRFCVFQKQEFLDLPAVGIEDLRMNEEELKALNRAELQQEAKKLGIKANQSSAQLIQQIIEKTNVFQLVCT